MSTTDVTDDHMKTKSPLNAALAQPGLPARRVPLLAASLAADLQPGGRSASLIVPRLYLTNFATATNVTQLESLGITHIVSALDFIPATQFPGHIKRLHVHLSDVASANILKHLEDTTEFINSALAENETNTVLVCMLPWQPPGPTNDSLSRFTASWAFRDRPQSYAHTSLLLRL